MNNLDDLAWKREFEHVEERQKQREGWDGKKSNDNADYQPNVIDDYKTMTISHEQSEQDKTRLLNQMRDDESIRDLNILFIKICLTAIALWIVVFAVVNIFWGFA